MIIISSDDDDDDDDGWHPVLGDISFDQVFGRDGLCCSEAPGERLMPCIPCNQGTRSAHFPAPPRRPGDGWSQNMSNHLEKIRFQRLLGLLHLS